MIKIGTSGFRGIIGDDFTKETVCKIMQATSNIILNENMKREVVLGYDNRFMSEVYARWCCEVLCANGIKVELIGRSTTSPLISFITKLKKNDMGIMVTASHNPYFYNGIKIFSKEGRDLEVKFEDMYDKLLSSIKKYRAMPFDRALSKKLVSYVDYSDAYVLDILNLIKFRKNISKLKVAFDVMNGSSLDVTKNIGQKLNLNMEIINGKRDALFSKDSPIPNEDHLCKLRRLVLSKRLDFGFATDGDGDRFAVIDDKGNYLCGNEIAPLIYYFLVKVKKEKGAFVKNYSLSLLADKVCKFLKRRVVETPIGFKHIGQAVVKNHAILGAENSGCEIADHAYTKDGLVIFALLLELMSYYNLPLSKIVKDMKKKVGYDLCYKEISFKVKDKKKVQDKLKLHLPKFKKRIKRLGNLDGIKIIFTDGTWILIRFSGTEDLLRLVAEQKNQGEVDEILKSTRAYVEGL